VKEQIKSFERLLSHAKELAHTRGKARAALIGADDAFALMAILRAAGEGILEPILIGSISEIRAVAQRSGVDIGTATVIDSSSRADEVVQATRLVGAGAADFLIRGNIPTAMMLARMFERPTGLRDGTNHVSHVAVFEHPLYPKLLLLSDGAVTVAPDLSKKVAIIQNALKVAAWFGVEKPRVAILAAVELIYPTMPVTTEAAVISKMADKGQIKNCFIDGPLSMDVAVIPDVARQKGVESPVAGQADILIVPNIETGNGTYKAMSMFAGAKTAGVIIGAHIPISISSRCDTAESVFHSVVLGAFAALSKK
jgi:phosphate butyryltransferase